MVKAVEDHSFDVIINNMSAFKTRGKINGNDGTARILKLHPSTLRFRIKKLGLVIERSPSQV